jgi:hypothetical protein
MNKPETAPWITDAEVEAVYEHAITGKPLDPDLARRIRERSEQATEELRRKVGIVDVAVDLIREVRDEE